MKNKKVKLGDLKIGQTIMASNERVYLIVEEDICVKNHSIRFVFALDIHNNRVICLGDATGSINVLEV